MQYCNAFILKVTFPNTAPMEMALFVSMKHCEEYLPQTYSYPSN